MPDTKSEVRHAAEEPVTIDILCRCVTGLLLGGFLGIGLALSSESSSPHGGTTHRFRHPRLGTGRCGLPWARRCVALDRHRHSPGRLVTVLDRAVELPTALDGRSGVHDTGVDVAVPSIMVARSVIHR